MDAQTQRLTALFGLNDEVAAFVRRRAAEVAAAGKQEFRYRGSCRHCGGAEPHPPHENGSYGTVRYGRLAQYCLGVPGAGLEIVVTGRVRGSAELPSEAAGYWFVGEEMPVSAPGAARD